jgi:4-hydroxybenzoate polyprenyltransferase
LLTLWREVVKDLEDLKGDLQAACQTLPVVVGEKSTRWFARILGVMVVAGLIYVVFTQFDGDQRFILLPILVVPAIVANRWLWQEGHSVFYRKASLMIKLTMLAGLIALALPK